MNGGDIMIDSMNVASYYLGKESMPLQKLQKLCYYSQAWALIMLNRRLFFEEVEAWVNGPSIPELHHHFRAYELNKIPMMIPYSGFSVDEENVLEFVHKHYSHYSSDELEWLSKNEIAWIESRRGISTWETSRAIISDDLMQMVDVESIDKLMARRPTPPISFGFKLWDFKLESNEDAISRGDWFQEIMIAMAEVTGKTKNELIREGYLRNSSQKVKLLEQYGFQFNKSHKEQYIIEEVVIRDRECSIFGVFIDQVFHIIWFVSKKYRGPLVNIDERVNLAMKVERERRDVNKLFELEKENKELESRNRELWDLLDEMTDPKIKKYKQ